MTEILRFEMNVPAEVALKNPGPGKPIEGRYGNRVMFTLADDRVMYVAPIVASQITDLGIQPGERFQVRKHLKKQGTRRLIEWDVQRVGHEPETQLERDLRESIPVAQTAKAGPPSEVTGESDPQSPRLEPSSLPNPATSPGTISASTDSSDGNTSVVPQNGNSHLVTALEVTANPSNSASHRVAEVGSHHECSAPPIPAPTPVTVSLANCSPNGSQSSTPKNAPPITTKLEHALKTAISAAYNAEKYSAELGYVVRFDADAIKSMAITVLINMSEGNRR
jgi:hypothetical protein